MNKSETLKLKTDRRHIIYNITSEVEELLSKMDVTSGICLVYSRHTTGAIIINENEDPNILIDIIKKINELIPDKDEYLHNQVCTNGAAHVKASLFGGSQVIPIKQGRLDLGRYQAIMFVELDGPRDREITVQAIY